MNLRTKDSLLFEAYRVRYTDADSTAFLANKAISLANDDKESVARAINLLAFVRYHEMNYGDALSLCDSVYLTSNNQVTLLCADVMRMKVCQRIGDGRKFYEARSSAGRRPRTRRVRRAIRTSRANSVAA